MSLQSPLFASDAELNAAATSDPAHITPGTKGAHVGKLQFALLKIDGSVIAQSELRQQLYGQSTAAAVLAYKRKRKIINPAYQTQADDIVGKMTMASLDAELQRCAPVATPRIRVVWGLHNHRPPVTPRPRFRWVPNKLVGAELAGAHPVSAKSLSERSPVVIGPTGPTSRIQVTVGGTATFRVENGVGDSIMCLNETVAKLEDPHDPSFDGSFGGFVTKDPHVFQVRGVNPGATSIDVVILTPLTGFPVGLVTLDIHVRPLFHPGVNHDHRPSGRWSEVQANPNSPDPDNTLQQLFIENQCSKNSPDGLIQTTMLAKFTFRNALARAHIEHYLKGGGADFVEDANIEAMLRQDSGVRAAIAKHIPAGQTAGGVHRSFALEQSDYAIEDFQFTFGGIDIFEFQADFDNHTLTVWFQDRYEWHPFYPKLYPVQSGDEVRPTNCIHAAFVEKKADGAADFWMIGEATVPLGLVTGGP
jgi:hypothetical protein